jgi:class 3 adenylate cyclase
LLNFFVSELRQKEELRNTFGECIDPRILGHLLPGSTTGDLAGGRRGMSVSFGDLVGFTAIGEPPTPAGVVNLLNRHFALQAEAVQLRHGVGDNPPAPDWNGTWTFHEK